MTSRYPFAVLGLLSALATCKSAPARSSSIIADVMPAVVIVVVGTMRDDRFVASSRGSGTIIDSNGLVLTNHHLLFDAKNNQLHDVFMIGLFRAGQQPELVCMGNPSNALFDPQVDLALIRCDRDLGEWCFSSEKHRITSAGGVLSSVCDAKRLGIWALNSFNTRFLNGRWQPSSWPTITLRETDVAVGEPVWVLGYPAIGEMSVRAGVVSGFTDGFIRTSAAIAHGHSGGAAIDGNGQLIGVPSGFRHLTLTQGKTSMPMGRIGLVTPIHVALALLQETELAEQR